MGKLGKIIQGDCVKIMANYFPNESIDVVVTDPPYGIKFMEQSWDDDCPSVEEWAECLRVLKPGGWLLSFSGTRTIDLIAGRIRQGGFWIKDTIFWLYGEGFPKGGVWSQHKANKGNNESKLLIEAGYEGWGKALKPACEPITMAQKPFKQAIYENVLEHGVGAINVDGCRIEACGGDKAKLLDEWNREQSCAAEQSVALGKGLKTVDLNDYAKSGRWPANVVLDEEAAQMLDEQTSHLQSSKGKYVRKHGKKQFFDSFQGSDEIDQPTEIIDSGGASRFFYTPKSSRKEREAGLEHLDSKFMATLGDGMENRPHNPTEPTAHRKNYHPTVKPISLMRWLVKLITPPNGLVLDPYCGTGTTCIAAGLEGFEWLGVENDKQYCEIAKARIKHWLKDEMSGNIIRKKRVRHAYT